MSKTKIEPLVHLNSNPCKMCMPLGSVTAFYGIRKSISILHGSQGCSTYIRRHMATHYNEPIDIASSSLTEEGTVFGGEKNLMIGLKNIIEVYHPEIIGVSTTCLAETIGEDVPAMIEKFYHAYPEYKEIEIIPVNSPGYGGTQFEGYYRALNSILANIKMDTTPNEYINVILPPMSPEDVRMIKETFEAFEIPAILFPDISDNLDREYSKDYEKLPAHGTSIEEIKRMAGARMTIELGMSFLKNSPGRYLSDVYQVQYLPLHLPVGIRDTDIFYELLSKLSGRPIPAKLKKLRGRYADSMIDAHKYNSDGRAVVFGEPDFVFSTIRLCAENGVMPVVVATGSVVPELKEAIEKEIKALADRFMIRAYDIVDDVDFKTIEALAVKHHANLMIGNSDGRRIEEELHIPLVRRGFPIHDRVGGQRLKSVLYDGSLTFMEEIANAVLSRKEVDFRDKLYNKYFKQEEESLLEKTKKETVIRTVYVPVDRKKMEEKTNTHPCYNGCASESARIHLPVAPKCNIQCNYCVRKFDCPNESRPGVTSHVLSPEEAFARYKLAKEKVKNLNVVGIAGPGDTLANFESTRKTLELIREYDPDVTFCLSTNGLRLPEYAQDLIALGVTHVTVTMNAVDIRIGAKIIQYVKYNGMLFEGESAAAILLSNQLAGLRILTAAGIICKVNIVTLKGINDQHIPEIVKTAKEIGCYMTNIMPFIQVKGSIFENLEATSAQDLAELRKECSPVMKQMTHCKQCRADAVGTLNDDRFKEFDYSEAACESVYNG